MVQYICFRVPSWRDAARYLSDFYTSGAANVAWSGVKRGKGARLSWEGNSPENDLSSPPTFSIAPHYHITHYPQLGVPMWSTLPCGVARRGVQLWCPDVVHITHITHYHVVWLGEVSKMQTKKAPERVLEPFK